MRTGSKGHRLQPRRPLRQTTGRGGTAGSPALRPARPGNFLVENYQIAPISTPAEDLEAILDRGDNETAVGGRVVLPPISATPNQGGS